MGSLPPAAPFAPHPKADSLSPSPSAATRSPFGRINNKSHHYERGVRGNIRHGDKSMKSIWLLSLKMPKCQRAQKEKKKKKRQRFSAPYQNPLILCDISRQSPSLCKCLPANLICTNVIHELDNNWSDIFFFWVLFCFPFFILSHWKQSVMVKRPPGDGRLGAIFSTMKEQLFVWLIQCR